MNSWTRLKMGHVGSKTRSLGQMLEKPCVHCRGHIFIWINMELGQNDFLDEIWNKFKKWACWIKNQVTRSNVRIPLCTL